MGAIAGLTIFLGLPVARMRFLGMRAQGFLNATATGVLIFLLVEILGHANGAVEDAMGGIRDGRSASFAVLAAVYLVGLAAGLLGLVWFNRAVVGRLRGRALRGPGGAAAAPRSSAR